MAALTFNFVDYSNSLADGEAVFPPGALAPFIRVDRKRYSQLRKKNQASVYPDLTPLRKRLPPEPFNLMRGALGLTLRFARTFFPAYGFFIEEFLRDEWLSAVGWHKKFHRDHVIHQPLVAYIGMRLLKQWQPSPQGRLLLDDCVDTVLTSPHCQYLRNYLQKMGAPQWYFKNEKELQPLRRTLWKNLFLDTFFLAALFHDLGYPWQFSAAIHEKLDPHGPLGGAMGLGAREIMSRYKDRLLFQAFRGYHEDPTSPGDWPERLEGLVRDCLTTTHGLPGALAFLHLNDALRIHPDQFSLPVRRFCLEWAAQAMLLHDLPKIYAEVKDGHLTVQQPHLQLSFHRDPLAFVLTLADYLQGFARPNAVFARLDQKNTTSGHPPGEANLNQAQVDNGSNQEDPDNTGQVKFKTRCQEVQLDWDQALRTMEITFRYNNIADVALARAKFHPEEALLFFDPAKGYLDLASLGIASVKLSAEKHE